MIAGRYVGFVWHKDDVEGPQAVIKPRTPKPLSESNACPEASVQLLAFTEPYTRH